MTFPRHKDGELTEIGSVTTIGATFRILPEIAVPFSGGGFSNYVCYIHRITVSMSLIALCPVSPAPVPTRRRPAISIETPAGHLSWAFQQVGLIDS